MDFLKRRKRLILGAAAGAAGAAAAYLWYSSYTATKVQQQRSVEMELDAILREGGRQQPASGERPEGSDSDGEGEGDDSCGSPDLDESLDSHFNYIQRVSAPQELTNLLPRLQATLFELTDVALLKQQQVAAAAAGSPAGVQEQLRLLSRLCFGRTVAAAFLLPLLDLCVRTKLNIIGRHLFLQEKFSKLRQPAAPAARMRLPPRLTAAAVEAFLGCEQLAERGAAWLAEQAMDAADRVLGGMPLDAAVSPEQLAGLVQAVAISLGQAATALGAATPTGSAWVDVLVGQGAAGSLLGGFGPDGAPGGGVGAAGGGAAAAGSAEAYRRAAASAAMVEELEAELRRVLGNYRFGEALHAAVGQCLGTCAAHIHATFISQAAAAQQAQAQQQQAQQQQVQEQQQSVAVVEAQERQEQGPAEQQQQQQPSTSAAATSPEEAQPAAGRAVSPFSTAASSTTDDISSRSASPSEAAPPPPAAPSPRACLAAAAMAAMQPRPLARCLRVVQAACEPLFADAREVSERIAALPPVMSLCAVAFASPLEL